MTQLTGTGTIPQPIEGYKLVLSGAFENLKNGEYVFADCGHGALRWVNKFYSLCAGGDDEFYTWQLLPILNSGIWVSGEMPLPEPQEGTFLLREYRDENCLGLPVIVVFYAINNLWQTLYWEEDNDKRYTTVDNTCTHWMWISAPKV